MDILKLISPNRQESKGRVPRFIILHGSGGGERGSVSWIGNPSSQVSYHYFIPKDTDPNAYHLVEDEDISWHAGFSEWTEVLNGEPHTWDGMNSYSVGVSFESLNRANEHYPEAQIQVGIALVKHLMGKWGIPASRVLTHKEVSKPQGRKIDPVNFPLDRFRDALKSDADKLLSLRLFLNDNAEGRIARAGVVADKLYLYTEV